VLRLVNFKGINVPTYRLASDMPLFWDSRVQGREEMKLLTSMLAGAEHVSL